MGKTSRCPQNSLPSSSTSAADVDVHTAWDNYDLIVPVTRRRSDDRCSLLTQWTDSSSSLRSCLSNKAISRSVADYASTATDSNSGAYLDCVGPRDRRWPVVKARVRRDRRSDSYLTVSTSKRLADGDSSLRQNNSRRCQFAKSADHGCREDGRTRRVGDVTRSSTLCGDDGRRRSTWSTARQRHSAVNSRDDDDYATTSSEDEDPSTSESSFAPLSCADDRSSLLSSSTTSSSAACAKAQTARPSSSLSSTARRCKSTESCRSLTTFNKNYDSDDVEEVTVASCYFSKGSKTIASRVARDVELRAVRSLFEFRSSDKLRIANDFIDGVWSLYSRRSLYNERHVRQTSIPPSSALQFCDSRSEKDSNLDCDRGEIVANDKKTNCSDISDGERRSLTTVENDQQVGNDDNNKCDLNATDVAESCGGVGATNDRNSSTKEFNSITTVTNATDDASVEDDVKVYNRKSKVTSDDSGNNGDTDHCVPVPKPVDGTRVKNLEDATISDVLTSCGQNKTDPDGGKVPGLSTLMPPGWLVDMPGLKKMVEGAGSSSRFATAEHVQVFDTLLVRSGTGEVASVAAMNMFQPLITGVKHCDATALFEANSGSAATTLTRPTGDEFGSFARRVVERPTGSNRNRCRKNKERKSDMMFRLASELLGNPHLSRELAVTQSTDVKETNRELRSPKQAPRRDKCIATTSTQTNNTNDPVQSARETRKRTSRKSAGQGKVRELIRLFESVSAPTIENIQSPTDLKRATITAAVSVGELLQRCSEQEVISRDQCARVLTAEQSKISSSRSMEALNTVDSISPVGRVKYATTSTVVPVGELLRHDSKQEVISCGQHSLALLDETVEQPEVWSPHIFEDECRPKAEDASVVPKSSRFRRNHVQRRPYTTSAGSCAASRIDLGQFPETRDSRSGTRATPANDFGRNRSQEEVDDRVKTLPETVPLSSQKSVKLVNKNLSGCRDTSVIHSRQPVAYSREVGNATVTSDLASVGVRHLPVVEESANSFSDTARQEKANDLSSRRSLSLEPSKSLHFDEVAVTEPGGSGDVSGPRQQEGRLVSSDYGKRFDAHFDERVNPKRNYTVRGKSICRPDAIAANDFPREQSVPSADSSKNAYKIRYNKETPSSCEEKNDDCQRFDVQCWFMAGGPRLVNIPRWLSTPEKDLVTVIYRKETTARHPAKATFETETGCPTVYPVVRKTGVTVRQTNKVDYGNRECGKRKETECFECAADSSCRKRRRRLTTQSTKKQHSSRESQAVRHNGIRTVTKSMTDDEQVFAECVSADQQSETDDSDAIPQTAVLHRKSDVKTSSGVDAFRRRSDVKTVSIQTNRDRLERFCQPATPVMSTNRPRTSGTVTHASDHRTKSVKGRDQADDSPFKRSTLDTESHRHTTPYHATTSPSRRLSSVKAECGEPIESPDGVTVVYTRRRTTSDRSRDAAVTTQCQLSGKTKDNYKRLAQQFLLASTIEHRLYAHRQ